jgi:peptidoglycan/LPS O-acetylase OafA/YrhL/lysophospholipase L1-like esterase
MTQGKDPGGAGAPPTRLAYYPSLDGLRGVALIAILFYHSGVNWIPGGFLSVSTFFTLSGFLITSLILYERESTGRVDLVRFWSRRVRRLMPGALTAFVFIAALGNAIGDASQLARLRWDGLSALFYVSNWRFIFLGNDYADLFASPSLVQHFWSLSIEEQFYLTYPLMAIALYRWGGRRALAWTLGVLTIASTLWMATLFEPDAPTGRLYFGTDTRAAEILLGALFALWHAGRRPLDASGRRAAEFVGGVGVAGTLVYWFSVSEATPWLWQGGFSFYALFTVAAIVGCVQPGGPARAFLGLPPFPWLGKISYGVYLYHFPVYVTLTPELTSLDHWPLFALRISVTFALSVASYYLLELPIRMGRLVTGRRRYFVLPAGVLVASVALVMATIDPPAPAVDLRPILEVDRRTGIGGPRIMMVGGSVAAGVGQGLQRWAQETKSASVYNLSRRGCGIARGGRLENQFKRLGDTCDDWPDVWSRKLDDFDPDVVVVLTGGWDIVDRRLPSWEKARRIGDDVYDAWLASEFDFAMDLLSSRGARVIWLTTPCYQKFARGSGVWDPERVRKLNRLLNRLAAQRGDDIEIVDLYGEVCPNGEFTDTLGGVTEARPDGAHFSDAGADWLARWLAPKILAVSQSRPKPQATADIVVIGDSLCESSDWVDTVFGPRAKNLCVSGSTSNWWASARSHWVPHIRPNRTWLILVGTNDAGLGVVDDYPANLAAIVEELVKAGQQVRLIHSPYVRERRQPDDESAIFFSDRPLSEMNAKLDFERASDLALCARYAEVQCGPDLIELLDGSEYFSDGVHFSALGTKAVAEAVSK